MRLKDLYLPKGFKIEKKHVGQNRYVLNYKGKKYMGRNLTEIAQTLEEMLWSRGFKEPSLKD